jgi:hypothetical protein
MGASGAQCQLACRGAQDVYLLSPADVTFWKTTYARHTNFAITELEVSYNSTPGFGKQKTSATITRAGDLLSSMYVSFDLPRIQYPSTGNLFSLQNRSYAYWVDAIGHALMQEVTLRIGQHEFDTMQSEYFEMFESLAAPSDRLLNEMTGRYFHPAACALASLLDQHMYVPLRFWFNRFTEQALPLVALYWHEVDISMTLRNRSELFSAIGSAATDLKLATPTITVPSDIQNMSLLCNYVYLDRPERAAFANSKSEYLIDATQFLGSEAVTGPGTVRHSIRYNHPVQEIIWAIRKSTAVTLATATPVPDQLNPNGWFDFSGNNATGLPVSFLPTDPFKAAKITLNNHDRTIDHPAVYYRQVQPYQSHSRIPHHDRWVYCYSFALKPEELLSSGTVNMSRMDSAYLNIEYWGLGAAPYSPVTDATFFCFARSKNVAKVTVGSSHLKQDNSSLTLLFFRNGW